MPLSNTAYAQRPISSPPSAQPPSSASSAYPQSSSPPYPAQANINNNNAAYRPGSSGGPQISGTVPVAQQRPYQPMAGQPAPQTTIPQNSQSQPGGGVAPPLLRRMDSRSSISTTGPAGPAVQPTSAVGATGQQQQQQQLTRQPLPPNQTGAQPNIMQRPPVGQPLQQQMYRPGSNPNPPQQQQQLHQPQQFQPKMPPNFQPQQQPLRPQLPQQPQQPQMIMRQQGPNGQPLSSQQMRPQFPGPRPGTGPQNQPMRHPVQAPGQFQQRISDDLMRPSSRNGMLSTGHDDDDDVVIGRAVTPNYQPRPNINNGSVGAPGHLPPRDPQLFSRPGSQQGNVLGNPQMRPMNPINSRPPSRPQSRPPSGPDNPSSPSPEGLIKQGVSFLDSMDVNKNPLNLRPIPELARDGGQQFRIGQMVNKPLVPNPNFQQSSANLNAMLNVDRSRPLARDLPKALSPNELIKGEIDAAGISKKVVEEFFTEN